MSMVVLIGGCALRVDAPTSTTNHSGSPSTTSVATSDTRKTLEALTVKGKAPKTGYSRSQYGRAWTDQGTVGFSGNGCLQNDDVLQRQLSDVVLRRGSQCIVESGVLNLDPYTGRVIPYRRGARPIAISVDHIVPLRLSWQTGAQQWDLKQRINFGTDPDNLVVVSSRANSQKSDSDPASWLPPKNRCNYVTRFVAVKAKYHLWVTRAERDAILRVLDNC